MKRLSYLSASLGAFKGWLYSPGRTASPFAQGFVDTLHDLSERDERESHFFGGCAPLFRDEETAVEWQRKGGG